MEAYLLSFEFCSVESASDGDCCYGGGEEGRFYGSDGW